MNRWLHWSSSFQGIFWATFLRCNIFRKRMDHKKFSFIATNNWIVLAVQRSVNCSFALIMSIFQKGLTEEEETSNSKTFFSTNKCHKGKSSFVMMDGYFQGWNLNISDIWLQPSNFMDRLPCSVIDKNFFFVIYHEGN